MEVTLEGKGLVLLGEVIGNGGEAEVRAVPAHPSLCVKLYKKPLPTHTDKLRVMISNPPLLEDGTDGHPSVAWPKLLAFDGDGACVGFAMRRVSGMQPLHKIQNPKARRKVIPNFRVENLVQVARNLAQAVDGLHQKGYVIGDLNDSNVLVSNQALVTLVDTDSFQVRDDRSPEMTRTYRCGVARPEFTPAELQGEDMKLVDRTIEHDCFALGIIIFQILMGGQHPFSATNAPQQIQSPGDRIQAGTFPFASTRKHQLQASENYALYRRCVPLRLWEQFELCFDQGWKIPSARPSAFTWCSILSRAVQELVPCERKGCSEWKWHRRDCMQCETTSRRARGDISKDIRLPASRFERRIGAISSGAVTMPTGLIAATSQGPSILHVTPRSATAIPHPIQRELKTLVKVGAEFNDSAGSIVRVTKQVIEDHQFIDIRTYEKVDGVYEPATVGLCIPFLQCGDLTFAISAASVSTYRFNLGNQETLQLCVTQMNGGRVLDIRIFLKGQPSDNAITLATSLTSELIEGIAALRRDPERL